VRHIVDEMVYDFAGDTDSALLLELLIQNCEGHTGSRMLRLHDTGSAGVAIWDYYWVELLL
jgi:hypothetical protein